MADTDDLEAQAERLEQAGDYRILRRVSVIGRSADHNTTAKRLGQIVDVEMTGQCPTNDTLNEVAISR